MVVTLGDGRQVECASGIRKMPVGPMPRVLASEVSQPRGRKAPIPVFLRELRGMHIVDHPDDDGRKPPLHVAMRDFQ